MLYEYFGNIHMHTTYSDGVGGFDELVDAAVQARLDFIYVTDHNVLVRAQEEGYRRGVLTMVGQEVHDDDRSPQRNHLLCLGVAQDLAGEAQDPQHLIDAVGAQGALSFLAHPFEEVTPLAPDHWSWESWEVTRYTGVEIWNYMSSFRGFTTSTARSLLMGFFPHRFTIGPLPVTLAKWDELTQDRSIVGIGGTDVHAWTYQIGPFRRVFLPYLHCAQALNTHLLLKAPLAGRQPARRRPTEVVAHDHAQVLYALRTGHCWTGYDLVGSTRGFRFFAWQMPDHHRPDPARPPDALLGDTLAAPTPGWVTHFRVLTPANAEIRLLHNGRVVARQQARQLDYVTTNAGVYRVEVWRHRWGRWRGWIFSNPIYVRH
jgi:hypothetical protein